MGTLSLRTRRAGDRTVVSVSGELDLATVPNLRDAALGELAAAGCRTLVLDLAGLTFLDSTGLGCWIELRNRAEEDGKALALESVPPAAARTVTISGLGPLFGLAPPAGAVG